MDTTSKVSFVGIVKVLLQQARDFFQK